MIYEYKNDKTGKIIEKKYPLTEIPPAWIVIRGEIYRRLFNANINMPKGWGE